MLRDKIMSIVEFAMDCGMERSRVLSIMESLVHEISKPNLLVEPVEVFVQEKEGPCVSRGEFLIKAHEHRTLKISAFLGKETDELINFHLKGIYDDECRADAEWSKHIIGIRYNLYVDGVAFSRNFFVVEPEGLIY